VEKKKKQFLNEKKSILKAIIQMMKNGVFELNVSSV
jgi:hypothetical protein